MRGSKGILVAAVLVLFVLVIVVLSGRGHLGSIVWESPGGVAGGGDESAGESLGAKDRQAGPGVVGGGVRRSGADTGESPKGGSPGAQVVLGRRQRIAGTTSAPEGSKWIAGSLETAGQVRPDSPRGEGLPGAVVAVPQTPEVEPERPSEGIVYDSSLNQQWFDTNSRQRLGIKEGMTGRAGTLALWVQSMWEPESPEDASFADVDGGSMRIAKVGDRLALEIRRPEGGVSRVESGLLGWSPGEWHHVAAAWDAGEVVFFIDGKRIGAEPRNGAIAGNDALQVYMGNDSSLEPPAAPAVLSGVRVFDRALPESEVKIYNQMGRFRPQEPAEVDPDE